VNKGGSPGKGGSGNGTPPRVYSAESTDWYKACRAQIEDLYPRIREIRLFDQIEACVRLFSPSDYAERLEGRTWNMVTQEGVNIPELHIFFTFESGHVVLQAAFADI
jgi:hypothetical protein